MGPGLLFPGQGGDAPGVHVTHGTPPATPVPSKSTNNSLVKVWQLGLRLLADPSPARPAGPGGGSLERPAGQGVGEGKLRPGEHSGTGVHTPAPCW